MKDEKLFCISGPEAEPRIPGLRQKVSCREEAFPDSPLDMRLNAGERVRDLAHLIPPSSFPRYYTLYSMNTAAHDESMSAPDLTFASPDKAGGKDFVMKKP